MTKGVSLLEGRGRTYGHVVVDEAQDLSPMQLRMVARRAPAGSVTVLGDLAQSTGPWWYRSWADVAGPLPQPDGWREVELTLGYRAPAPVIELASRLLPAAAPGIRPTGAVRPGRRLPVVRRVGAADLARETAAEAAGLAAEGLLTGCIVAPEHARAVLAALRAAGADAGAVETDGLSRRVTVLAAAAAKGLELDAVVVAEPSAIAGVTARGLRLLYVALTRPIQHLSIVHAEPLPAPLR